MNSSRQTVRVNLELRSYDVRIGRNLLQDAGNTIRNWLNTAADQTLRCFLVTDENVLQPHCNAVRTSLKEASCDVRVACVPSGEASKSLKQLSELYDELVDFAADRKTVIVAVGGGVVGDLAGFAAASYARGLPFVQVPTTLLAQVDSSVGGKTGINHPQGKNLIGAFHQPAGVLIDTDTLITLSDRDYRSGLAEVIKYGVILDEAFFEYLEQNVNGLNSRDPEVLRQIIARSCELKAEVVRADEFETSGLRAVLNYGHTYAHAFEALSGYGRMLHGEAVAVGMICGSRLAWKLGRITDTDIQRQRQLLSAVKLPVDVPPELQEMPERILERMLLDKKTVSGDIRFVLPDRIGHVEAVSGIQPELITECLA